MSPVTAAMSSLHRAVASFHPRVMPRLARAHYRRELTAWLFLPVMLSAVEGGVAGVLAKNLFEPVVETRRLNFAIAVVSSAPAFANVLSIVWAAVSHGRDKIRFLVAMQILTALAVGLIALVPRSPLGLVLLVIGVAVARTGWSGVVTIRSTVWRQNYPRIARATLAGKLATVQAIIIATVGMVIGALTVVDEDAFRFIYPAVALVGLVGSGVYRGLRLRGHRALLRAERGDPHHRPGRMRLAPIVRVLRSDRAFRNYMLCMFVFGTGNLMVSAPLIIMLRDRFGMGELQGVLVASSIPVLLMPASIPIWSRLLDRVHVIRFRAVHCWAFVAANGTFFVATLLTLPALLYVGAVLKGLAIGGGVLGWNLGHHDFAPRHLAGRYMGVHVTLTGVRGLIAPGVGVAVYEVLEAGGAGRGPWVLALCVLLTTAGGLGFIAMARRHPVPARRSVARI